MKDTGFTIIENEWITLADGTRLAAKIWMPDGAQDGSFPAVLEYLPYRKRNGTDARDDSTYPAFARAGIAGVRVDIRGSGESEGVIDGEYTPRELSDAVEVIAWIAAQPWSNGAVGMMGISWGGFNALQVAALRPPQLKAVISIASTVDRYNDDIHYKDGCHLAAQLSWAGTMQAYQSRPPDPAIVGERWREMWLERLRGEPLFMEEWLAHQRRDAFWQHGSVCEDFSAIEIPCLVIAGWGDGYRNTPLKAAAGMGDRVKAMIGPWVHKYPHFAYPHPRADFLGMAIAWWRQWLGGEAQGCDALPQVRAFILDSPRPQPWRESDAGRWVAKPVWSEPEWLMLHLPDPAVPVLAAGDPGARAQQARYLRSPLDTGVTQGEFFTMKPADMPGDQRLDDGGSFCVETAPLEAPLDLLGQPRITLRLSCAGDTANLAVRLVDVHPDGAGTRISYGVLNLAYRQSQADPRPMPQGEMVEITMDLDACGYRLRAGHRLRVALSTALWPTILPTPGDPGVTLDTASLRVGLPLLGAHDEIEVPAPENPNPLPTYVEHSPGTSQRRVTHDLAEEVTRYEVLEDTGGSEVPGVGSVRREVQRDVWTIRRDDPTSLTGLSEWACSQSRGGWQARSETRVRLRCSTEEWFVETEITAWEQDEKVFERREERKINRDLM